MSDHEMLERRDIPKYPRPVADLLMYLVNDAGIRFRRIDGQHIALYPPDGVSRPFKVSGSRPAEAQVEYIEKQFMKVYDVPGPDGTVPHAKDEEEIEVTTVTEKLVPSQEAMVALRALAETLGVTMGGGVSEEDYLAVVAEKDYCSAQAEALTAENENLARQVEDGLDMARNLTTQRDNLLARVQKLEDLVDMTIANLKEGSE